ncbi:unnamed protein product, partial [Prorocentrum cordatum]
ALRRVAKQQAAGGGLARRQPRGRGARCHGRAGGRAGRPLVRGRPGGAGGAGPRGGGAGAARAARAAASRARARARRRAPGKGAAGRRARGGPGVGAPRAVGVLPRPGAVSGLRARGPVQGPVPGRARRGAHL